MNSHLSGAYVLGVDGGGTKTLALLVELDGDPNRPLAQGVAGSANLRSAGSAKALEALTEACNQALAAAKVPKENLVGLCVAAAGAGRPEEHKVLTAWAMSFSDTVFVMNDAEAVLAAGSPERTGIALIAGTGSLAFGRNADGGTARAGGWGYLFGDEGGGYAVGVAGLRAVAKACDGRGPATNLTSALFEQLKIDRPEQLVPSVYGGPLSVSQIADLAAVVAESAANGDPVSREILAEAGRELALMVRSVQHQLQLAEGYTLCVAGGLLVRSRLLQEKLREQLETICSHPGSIYPIEKPAHGAVRIAQAGARQVHH